jgi:hypothetical protein
MTRPAQLKVIEMRPVKSMKPVFILSTLVCLLFFHEKTNAQTIVVTPCQDQSNSELGKQAELIVARALQDTEAKLVGYGDYMQEVARLKIGKKNALTRWGMQKVAAGLKIDGIITSSALRQGKKYLIAFFLFGPDGKQVAKKAYRLAKPKLPLKTARKMTELFVGKVMPKTKTVSEEKTPAKEDMPLVPLAAVESKPPEVEPEVEPKVEPGVDKVAAEESKPDQPAEKSAEPDTPPPASEKDQQQWQGLLKQAEENPQADASGQVDDKPLVIEEESPPEMQDTKPSSSARASRVFVLPSKPKGSLPEIMIAAGMSINTRGGLSPRHEAGAYPGMRIDGRVFLGSLTDTLVLRDIGFEGMFAVSLALSAKPELLPETRDASQMRWNAGLVYRLAFNSLPLAPAFLFRFGYGATSYKIDFDHPEVINAGYTYTSGVLEIDLSLVGTWLIAQLAGGYLFSVWPTDELSGDGSGFLLSAGLRTELFGGLSLGVGYEQLQFLIDDRSLGRTSDRYQQFYLRVGWFYR